MRQIDFMGLPNCLEISNGTVQVIATTAVGPRVLAYRFTDGENIFGEHPEIALQTAMGVWKPYGGHRLWAAPENMPLTYYPDNEPISYDVVNNLSVRLRPPEEKVTRLQKEIRVTLAESGTGVTLEHLITNCGSEPVELAPWAITVLRGGGTSIIPQEPFRSHDEALLPARSIALWHFTDLADPRYSIGQRLIQLATDPDRQSPQKIGAMNKQGWAAYYSQGLLFVKEMEYYEDALYPDYGCNAEAYSQGNYMELESLDMMQILEPGDTATHLEQWRLFKTELSEDENERADRIEELLREGRNAG